MKETKNKKGQIWLIVLSTYKPVIFFAIIIFAILPIIVLPLYSKQYHKLFNIPHIKNHTLKLNDYDLLNKSQIPLDGEWEFYPNIFLITDTPNKSVVPYNMTVPKSFDNSILNGSTGKKSSYRILIKDNEKPTKMVVHIPNIVSNYKAFINGQLSTEKNSRNFDTLNFRQQNQGILVSAKEAEIVIELESTYINGLYMVPYLTEVTHYEKSVNVREIIANSYFGVLVIFILYLAFIVTRQQHQEIFPAFTLIIMDFSILLRLLTKDELYEITNTILPILKNYWVSSFLQIIILFLPLVFLYCAKKLFSLKISKDLIVSIFIYECLIGCIAWLCIVKGNTLLLFSFTIIGYFPFTYVVYKLYQQLKQEDNNILIVTAILLFALSSTIGGNLNLSGLVITNVSLFAPTCIIISVILQLILYTEQNNRMYIKALEAENLRLQLKETNLSLMLSQIQPHFIYNSLLTIHVLCTEEPETAADIVLKFTNYLRNNIRFAQEENMIPFEQELNHIKNYIDIEKQRFGSKLTMNYDIQIQNFSIPPLSIQPLVENAVRYGACKRVDGNGFVCLKTYIKDEFLYIVVIDNGPGFFIDKNKKSDSFGISNISLRLKELMNAKVEFEQNEELTKAVIIIPTNIKIER